jgi:hypothetical protein
MGAGGRSRSSSGCRRPPTRGAPSPCRCGRAGGLPRRRPWVIGGPSGWVDGPPPNEKRPDGAGGGERDLKPGLPFSEFQAQLGRQAGPPVCEPWLPQRSSPGLSFYSFFRKKSTNLLIIINNRIKTKRIKNSNSSLDHLTTTTHSSESNAHPFLTKGAKIIVVKLVIIDIRKVVVIRFQKISAPEQQPSSTMRIVDHNS